MDMTPKGKTFDTMYCMWRRLFKGRNHTQETIKQKRKNRWRKRGEGRSSLYGGCDALAEHRLWWRLDSIAVSVFVVILVEFDKY